MKKYEFAWKTCPRHKWEHPADPQKENEVICSRCGMPGEKDKKTKKVFYPAT